MRAVRPLFRPAEMTCSGRAPRMSGPAADICHGRCPTVSKSDRRLSVRARAVALGNCVALNRQCPHAACGECTGHKAEALQFSGRTRSGGLSDNVSSRLGANRNRKTFQMSRGHGHIERLVLSSLGVFTQADVQTIAYRAGVRHGSVSVALRSSINRALRNLCRQGLVREAGKYGSMKEWTLTAKHRKEQKRQARERA